jgi:hypothetical protein
MSLITAVMNRGQMCFMIKEKGGVNAGVFIEFLNHLMVGAMHPIFLIVDRGPAHRAKTTSGLLKLWPGNYGCFLCSLFAGS